MLDTASTKTSTNNALHNFHSKYKNVAVASNTIMPMPIHFVIDNNTSSHAILTKTSAIMLPKLTKRSTIMLPSVARKSLI